MKTADARHETTLAVEAAIQVLKAGGVIAFPTETTYGLGCDPRNASALSKIYRMKGRDKAKALPLVACSMEHVERLFKLPEKAKELADEYWPGALAMLLEPAESALRKSMPVFKDGLAAVRVSSHPFVHELTCTYGFPLVATSANLSGDPACLSAEQVMAAFMVSEPENQPDLIINGGELEASEPSTIIKFDGDDVTVIRQGSVNV
ncbi:threonylcarbamoyl-AMP synthase [Candidatus Uhrbacteria bacterium]|nr:threonylcarbamoyl-AMP synthase [Candidatus Uhrbacteria bacterium]